jgi:hypothetical protein
MLNFLKSLLVYRTTRGAWRLVGLGKLGVILGLIGGYRAYRRHQRGLA